MDRRQQKTTSWLIVLAILVFACLCLGCLAASLAVSGLRDWGVDLFPEFQASWQWQSLGESHAAEGTLRLAGGDPVTLDPALVEDSTSSEYVVKIFSGLVGLDADLQVRPELAERWDVSPDGQTYTFYLREDAQFQNGQAVISADVAYSLDRALAPETGSPVASLYLGDIVGAAERQAGIADEVAGITIVDERTVRIQIDAPKAYFLAKLTYPTAAIIDRADVASGPGWFEQPNGTGPYRLEAWTQNEIVLESNPRYFRGEPAIKQVVFDLSAGDPTTMYETGELDVAPVGLGDFERVTDPANALHAELVEVPSLNVQYVALNTRMAPFDDVLVRQAFLLATDRKIIARAMFKGSVEPAEGILPPGMPGYNDALEYPGYDPVLARTLLKQSSYGGTEGLPPIVFATSAGGSDLAEALAFMYSEALGVEVEIQQLGWGDFLRDVNRNRYPMFFLGWSADYPDPENFLDIHFHSGSEGNTTGYSNPEVDLLLEQARVEQDTPQRMIYYQEAEQIIVDEAPWIPLYHGVDYVLVKPYVKGFSVTAQGAYYLDDVLVEEE